MKKINKILMLSAILAGIFGVPFQKSKDVVKIEAASQDRLLYFERAAVESLPEWWIKDDETYLHYHSTESGDVNVKMDKEGDIFTATIPGTILDADGGFNFIVYNTYSAHNQTQWNDVATYRDNGHNYFLLTQWNGEGKNLTTVSSIHGEKYVATKYKGESVIGTEEIAKNTNYTPSFVYQQGFKLEGWFRDLSLTTPYVVGPLSSDISLYGKYTAINDYYVYFRKPDTWGSTINAYYYRDGSGVPLGKEGSGWPGDPMTEIMEGGHGYAIKVDAGYSPNMIIFNDGTNQTDNTPLVAGKVYTYTLPEEGEKVEATPHDFEYRLFKSWGPWDDEAKALAAHNYDVGNGVSIALKAGDTVKMNISSEIWAPFAKLTGTNASTYFEVNEADDNYKAKLSGVYKFTYNESFALGTATESKTAQITADNSSVSFELVTEESERIIAVDQRLAEINTCALYEEQNDYVAFVIGVLGVNGMTLISEQNQAKLDLMNRYIVTPPVTGIKTNTTTSNVVVFLATLLATTVIGTYFLLKKKRLNKNSR